MKKITVMSAGNGGQALAGDLALRGHSVILYEHPKFAGTIKAIQDRGNTIEMENKITGTAKLAGATTDAAEALKDAEIIYFTAPSFAQEAFFDLAAPHFKDGQVLVLSPGNYGTLSINALFRKLGKKISIGETDNLPYACAAVEPGRVNVRGVKDPVTLAVFPSEDYPQVDSVMKDAFCTSYKKGTNVFQTSMSNTNMIVHCVPMLMNAGRIENTGGDFSFYFGGMPRSVCKVMEMVDAERISVGKAFGLSLASTLETIKTQYRVDGDDLYSVIQANPAFGSGKPDAPKTLDHRFLTEDTPYSMVPLIELGNLAGVPTPIMDAVAALCSAVMGENYLETGQTLSRMGLEGKSVDGIIGKL